MMNKMDFSLKKIYASIERDIEINEWDPNQPLLSRNMDINEELNVVFAIDKSIKQYIMYLSCNETDVVHNYKYPSWQGISISYASFHNQAKQQAYLKIEQSGNSDKDIFLLVAQDIVNNIMNTKSRDLRKVISKTLERWKKFFSIRKQPILTFQEQLGLFGELWLIKYMLQNGIPSAIIDRWKGPYKGIYDFSLNKMAVEVKSTAATLPYKAYINNENQLDTSLAGGKLHLSFIAVITDSGTGETISDIINDIETLIADQDSNMSTFRDKIWGCGIGSPLLNQYETKFHVKNNYFFEIKDGFPRVLQSHLCDGIGDLSYSIMISACMDFNITSEMFITAVKQHLGG